MRICGYAYRALWIWIGGGGGQVQEMARNIVFSRDLYVIYSGEYVDMRRYVSFCWIALWIWIGGGGGQVQEMARITATEIYAKEGGRGRSWVWETRESACIES